MNTQTKIFSRIASFASLTAIRRRMPMLATLILSLSISLVSTPLTAQNTSDAYRIETFRATQPEVTVKTSGGKIEIKGSDRSDVEVRMFVRKGMDYVSPDQEDLKDWEVTIKQDGNRILAVAERKSSIGGWFTSTPSVSFVILTPVDSDIDAMTSGGSMGAENLRGTLSMNTSGGSIDIENIEGETTLRTSGGSIDISAHKGTLDGTTSGGAIDLEGSEGTYEIRTSGGSIDIEDVKGSVIARTSGGSIDAELLALDGPLDLSTSGGSIDIEIPAQQGYDLDLSGTKVDADLVEFTGSADRQIVKGTIKGGGNLVKARTSGGTVKLEFTF